MRRLLRHITIFLLFIFVLGLADGWGQDINSTPPPEQHVCEGKEITYTVFGFINSNIEWYVDDLHLGTDKDRTVPSNGDNIIRTNGTYNKVTLQHTWSLSDPTKTEIHTLKIQETSADPAACATMTEPGLKVYVYPKPAVPVVTVNPIACNGEQGGLSVDLSGVTIPTGLSLQIRLQDSDNNTLVGWADVSGNSHTYSNLSAGSYKVTIRYVKEGNRVRGSVVASPIKTLVNPPVLTVSSAAVTTPIACNGGDAEVTIVASGGTAPYTYTFNGVENTTDGVFTSKAGTYSYHVTDANGCSTAS
ncbi:SprB repeat-containing protein [Marinifilum fragile]|uniref:SprB repeat-containing protein n=1 Tax=Marinifilum fragile TaxID=570161 RepID=UPI002AA5E9A5|nr:SprB repeat-containing protein [Marinifilum fragile]